MKQLHMIFGTLTVFLIASSVSLSSRAERYMLIYKNDQAFSQIHSRWVLTPSPVSTRILSLKNDEVQGIEVEESLSHVQSVIVHAADQASIAQIAGPDVIIEKEIFHKAPRPVLNYEPTQAWDYSIQYAEQYAAGDHDLMARKKKKKKKPAEPNIPPGKDSQKDSQDLADLVGPKTPWGILNVKAMDAWEDSDQGQGSRVLVLDSGIDENHPGLKNQIEELKDFVGDNQEPVPTADKVGHGTHVAGTIAAAIAADGFTGVAPKAKILAGRVCSEMGCSSLAVVSGINWGIEKKVDVINMSLGSDFSSISEKNAVEKADKAGVVVVAASGNDNKASVGYPAAYPSVIAVGAIDPKNMKADFSQWGPQLDIVGPGVDVESTVPMGSGCEPVVLALMPMETEAKASCFSGSAYIETPIKKSIAFAGLGKAEDFNDLDLTNKFALIERGEINFAEKVQNAMAANAAGVVIFNNKPGLMSGAITEDGSILAIPIIMVEQTMGASLRKALDAGINVEISISTAKSNYSAYSGTSMASPHVAGVVALIKSANKNLTPEQVRTVLKESTTLITDTAGNAANWYGAGAVNAENAVAKAVQLR